MVGCDIAYTLLFDNENHMETFHKQYDSRSAFIRKRSERNDTIVSPSDIANVIAVHVATKY